jgi:hypothetical protein
MNSRGLNLGLILGGAVLQAFAAFNVDWIAPYRAGLLGLAGTLLLLGRASRAFGRAKSARLELPPAAISKRWIE